MPEEKIEIIPVEILDRQRTLVEELKSFSHKLGIELGWHYLLDLAWILSQLGELKGRRIMDAGAGLGLVQWYLAEHGADVLSVDRSSRTEMLRLRTRYRIDGLRPQDIPTPGELLRLKTRRASGLPGKTAAGLRAVAGLIAAAIARPSGGLVTIYNQDLLDLPDVPSASLDAVVAVSALEHNPPEELPKVVNELMRLLRPGGVLLATLGTSRDKDWFHEPSRGWCYTEATLRKAFDLPKSVRSNYNRHDELMAGLKGCAELRDNLARMYFLSADNGMPWGKWDPQYQPVGVYKIKA
ncbi:MAG: class I SAM-dependent methyltransferase [Chloroflexota bacterium]